MARPDKPNKNKPKTPTAKEMLNTMKNGKKVGGNVFKPISSAKGKKQAMPRKRGM